MYIQDTRRTMLSRLALASAASLFSAGWSAGVYAAEPETFEKARINLAETGVGPSARRETIKEDIPLRTPASPRGVLPTASLAEGSSSSYLLMPAEALEQQPAVKTGCWARIYDDRNFSGGALTLSGPLSMPTMLGPFGINWKNRVRSIEVGKNAAVTVYDNMDFKQQITSFSPGERIPDLSKKMGYFDDFSSLRISCKV
ncbi:beta/gamma crystallin domain-containing protein [Noviherbaspirillum aerium]|uniref:beta/gamma crystallin domain-containing protein n=1 Tax=Noviherbaspirillum aerium TaxID=2588497 RepID=UPI00124DF49C|nr:beta/gamma crystallin domain-containing protein [Noviherbaspirillum aerium]